MPSLRELIEYQKPTTLDEAIQLLRRPQIRSVPIAGGTQLVPSAAHDIEAVIDLSGLNLSYVKPCEGLTLNTVNGVETFARMCIGATTTLQQIVEDKNVRDYADGVLVKTILDSASRNTRNAASIAGSIVGAAGNSPLVTTLLALDARLTLRGDGEQQVALSEWLHDAKTLIVEVRLPQLSADTHAAYEKVARTPADLPIVCVAARGSIEYGKIVEARIALGGVADRPVVIDRPVTSIEQAAQLAMQSIDPSSDYFASAEYRREMIGVLVRRVLQSIVH